SENICPVCKASQCLSTDPCPAHGKEFTDKTDSSESIPLKKTCRISSDYLPSSFPRFLKSRVKIGDMSVKLVNLDSYFAKRMKCPSPSTTNPSTLLPLILPSLPSPETQESPPVTDEDEEAGIDPDDPGFLKWYKRFDYRMQSKLRARIDYSQATKTRNFSLKLFLYSFLIHAVPFVLGTVFHAYFPSWTLIFPVVFFSLGFLLGIVDIVVSSLFDKVSPTRIVSSLIWLLFNLSSTFLVAQLFDVAYNQGKEHYGFSIPYEEKYGKG
ncbi:hypothetical protein ADUPG1_006060, partial [Aduncisulcus paluster]